MSLTNRLSGVVFLGLLVSAQAAILFDARQTWPDPYSLRPAQLLPLARYINSNASEEISNWVSYRSFYAKSALLEASRTVPRRHADAGRRKRQTPYQTTPQDTRPTPEPTGSPSPSTTVHIVDAEDFALIMPGAAGGLVSDAEADGISFCTPGTADPACTNRLPDGFITAAAISNADDGSWIQVTGCMDATKFHLDPSDTGGQFDVRYPNGAQCTFGGYGASFIELVEPALNRFCMRCCSSADDQVNCNSHMDRLGCENAVPGQYDFPDLGVSCS